MPRKPVSTTKSAPRASTAAAKPKAVVQPVKPTAAAVKSKPTAKTPAKPVAKVPISAAPSTEQISKRAYEIWLRKGRPLGQDTQNWLEAEAELKTRR